MNEDYPRDLDADCDLCGDSIELRAESVQCSNKECPSNDRDSNFTSADCLPTEEGEVSVHDINRTDIPVSASLVDDIDDVYEDAGFTSRMAFVEDALRGAVADATDVVDTPTKCCTWCNLPRHRCSCDNPTYVMMDDCEHCGEFTDLDKLREVGDQYVCPRCEREVLFE